MKFPKVIQRFLPEGMARTKSTTFENDYTQSGFEDIGDSQSLAQYKKSLYLFIGVSMIARRVAGVPFSLYKIKNTAGDIEEVLSHDILLAMNRPNVRQTRKEFIELTVMFYLLAGDAFWYLERKPGSKKITGMYALRPDNVEVVLVGESKDILAYEYRSGNGTVMHIPSENILHFKNTDPANSLRGVGVVRPASSRIITEREASKYQAQFFKNQGRPDVAVFVNTEITSDEAEEARDRWKKVYGGGNGGQAGFFGNDIKELRELNVTPKEMDFIASQKFLRDDILASLHIPKAMITSDDVNLANAQTARTIYLEEAVLPIVETLQDILNNKFLPYVDDTLMFTFENPVPEDRELILKELTAGVGKWLTQNEARHILGYDAIEGADVLAPVAFGSAQLATVQNTVRQIFKSRTMLYKRLVAIEALAKTIDLTVGVKRERNSIFPTEESKQVYAKAFNKNADKRAGDIKDAIDDFHKGMMNRILKKNEDGFTANSFMDIPEEKNKATMEIGKALKALYKENGEATMRGIMNPKKAVGDAEEFVFTEEQQVAYNKRIEFFASSVVDHTFDTLKGVIVDGLSNGDGVDKIGQALRAKFADIAVGRAKTIARTETSYALSMSTNDAYGQSTIVTGKEWISVGDDKVRDEHAMNAGVIVDKNGVFPSGERWPGDATINCRCVLAPAV